MPERRGMDTLSFGLSDSAFWVRFALRNDSATRSILQVALLDFSKIEAGTVELFAEDIDVGEFARGVAATLKALLDKKGNRLEVAVASDVGTVHSDLMRMRQILFDLTSANSLPGIRAGHAA